MKSQITAENSKKAPRYPPIVMTRLFPLQTHLCDSPCILQRAHQEDWLVVVISSSKENRTPIYAVKGRRPNH